MSTTYTTSEIKAMGKANLNKASSKSLRVVRTFNYPNIPNVTSPETVFPAQTTADFGLPERSLRFVAVAIPAGSE